MFYVQQRLTISQTTPSFCGGRFATWPPECAGVALCTYSTYTSGAYIFFYFFVDISLHNQSEFISLSLSLNVTRSVWSSRFQPRNDDRKQQYCVEFASWVVNRSTLPTDLTAAAKTDFCFLLFWSTHAFAWLQFRVRFRSHGKRRPWERASRISNKPIVCRRRSVGVF